MAEPEQRLAEALQARATGAGQQAGGRYVDAKAEPAGLSAAAALAIALVIGVLLGTALALFSLLVPGLLPGTA
jgi:hypothetical protein